MGEEQKNENEQVSQPEPQAQNATEDERKEFEAKLADALKQAETFKDLMYRKAAEFENYKKRTENEIASVVKFANENLIGELLPVLDDFERSIKAAKVSKDFESLYRGLELIYQKLVKSLEKRGVKTFETVGKEFNVEFHDALLQIPRQDVAPHTVLEEIEKGYMLNERVIRHAKVVVSTTPADGEPASASGPLTSENQPEPGTN
ncbi:MAG TPA: nucleotide exchange factor GrpE [Bacteroidota bacterium]